MGKGDKESRDRDTQPTRSRSTRACDTCKRKRQKCCGSDPCACCEAANIECTYSVPQRKRGPKKEDKAAAVSALVAVSNNAGAAVETKPNESDLRQRVRHMESILTSLLRGAGVVKEEQTEQTADGSRDSAENSSDDEDNDNDLDNQPFKRARILEVSEHDNNGQDESPAVPSANRSHLDQPDIAHLINALNSSTNPDSMKATLDLINQLQFASNSSKNINKNSAVKVPVVQIKPEKGFRGIALSLQRKMRRAICGKDGNSPQSEFSSSASYNSPTSSSLVGTSGRIHSTVVEDLASDAILFFGATSTTTSSAWRQSPRFSGGIMNISLSFEANPPSLKVTEGDYSPPCSLELVLHLVGMYFKHVHPYFPMIHKPRFFQQFKEKRTDHFNLLLHSMCALMSQQCRDLTAWGISNPIELHMAFFERARVLLGHQFDWPHINNVQALLLLCIVGQGTNINATSYHYIGIAHRLAVELGMHRNLDNLRHPSLDPELLESMRTTWFCLYVLDRYTSVVEGRPMAISDQDWDTPFPVSKNPDIEMLRYHVGLCEILGRIANFVNRPSRPGSNSVNTTFAYRNNLNVKVEDPKQVMAEISSHLTAWHTSLPNGLQHRPDANSNWSFHHHIHAMYHTARVLLHRLDGGKFDQSCSKNAVEISRVLECLPSSSDVEQNTSEKGKLPALANSEFVFVVPLIVYSALTCNTLFLDLALVNKSEDVGGNINGTGGKKRKYGHQKPNNSYFSYSGEASAEISVFATKQLRKSLVAFDRLKTTSLFANYYGQLIMEVLKNDGIVLPVEDDCDDSEFSPSPDEPAIAAGTTQSLFNIFSSSMNPSSSANSSSFLGGGFPSFGSGFSVAAAAAGVGSGGGTSSDPRNSIVEESIATRLANSVKAIGDNWNEFLHLSPKMQNSHMFQPQNSSTSGPSEQQQHQQQSMSMQSSLMNAASNMSFPNLGMSNLAIPNLPRPNLPNLPNLPNIPNPITALREFSHGFLNYGMNSTLVVPSVGVGESRRDQNQTVFNGNESVSTPSQYFDIFSDLMNNPFDAASWPDVSLSSFGRRMPGFGSSSNELPEPVAGNEQEDEDLAETEEEEEGED